MPEISGGPANSPTFVNHETQGMLKRTHLQDESLDWIKRQGAGRLIKPPHIYMYLQEKYPDEISTRGDSSWEPRYRNDARWALKTAERDQLVTRLRRGIYRRNPGYRSESPPTTEDAGRLNYQSR